MATPDSLPSPPPPPPPHLGIGFKSQPKGGHPLAAPSHPFFTVRFPLVLPVCTCFLSLRRSLPGFNILSAWQSECVNWRPFVTLLCDRQSLPSLSLTLFPSMLPAPPPFLFFFGFPAWKSRSLHPLPALSSPVCLAKQLEPSDLFSRGSSLNPFAAILLLSEKKNGKKVEHFDFKIKCPAHISASCRIRHCPPQKKSKTEHKCRPP